MTKKFDRILSEDDLVDIFALGMGNLTAKPFDELVEVLEQAILAKLVEQQEPSAFYIHDNKATDAYYTDHKPEAQEWAAKGVGVTALYAHPIPNCQGLLDNSTQVHRNFVKQLAYKHGVKQGSDEINDGVYAFANEIASLVSSVALFDNEVKNHIADMRKKVPEGWQLVRVDPSEAQCLLIAKECGFEARHSSRVWGELLAAAPKYTGEK